MTDPFGLNSIPQVPRATFPSATGNGLALQTDPSNLEKFFDVLNKPGAAEDQVAINVLNGQPATQGVSDIFGWNPDQGLFGNLNNLVSANNTYQPTGGDVIQAIRGGGDPDTTLGKVAQAVGGFALNVLNPADPLNWLGIGEMTDAGRAAEMAGKEVPFVKGLLSGERSAISLTPPLLASWTVPGADQALVHGPQFLSNILGGTLQGAGDIAMKIPGVSQAVDAFTPAFNALKNYSNSAISGAKNIFGTLGGDQAGVALARTFKDAAEEVGEGALERLNKPMASYYQGQNYTPDQIVSKEIRRQIEAPIVAKQLTSVKEPGIKEFLGKIPTEGPTTPKIQAIADQMKGVLNKTSKLRKGAGLSTMGNGYFPRFLSDARKKVFADAGIDVTHGERVIKQFTTEQMEGMRQNPELRAKFYKEYLAPNDNQQVSSKILDSLKQADPQAGAFYEDDALQSYGRHLKNTAQEVSTSDALTDILKNPDLARLNKEDWNGTGKAVDQVDIDPRFKGSVKKAFPEQEIISGENIGEGFPTKVWVPHDTAHEFRNFMGIMTHADQMNKSFGALEAGWRTLTGIYKKATLLTPLGGLHTALRDHIGNHFQSYMAHAWSPTGNAIASKLTLALKRAGEDPEQFTKEAEKLEVFKGLNLGEELAVMKKANMFEEGLTKHLFGEEHFGKFETASGMKAISELRKTSENFSRIQHYITRRLQGWTPKGAVMDVRKVLYDYVGGLSAFEKKLQNVFPWYSWSRFNIPAMVEATLRHPGRASAFHRAKQNIEGVQSNKPDERALDEYVKGDPHIRMWQDPSTGKWTYMRVKGFLPIGDLEDISSMEKFGNFMESSLSPYIKAPLENTMNQSLFFKTAGNQPAPIENYPGQTGPFLGMNMPRTDINILRNVRPLNELNRLIPGNTTSNLSPSGTVGQYAGFNFVPIDLAKATENARYAFQKQKSNLTMAFKRQQQQGKPTSDIQNLLANLQNKAYQP